ncbi:hypothetical protein C8R46DRAFT_1197359 [Mycena filopes]|nr:hypothetical protein C8R46DRAFT_1197359 [Mycena filopes]
MSSELTQYKTCAIAIPDSEKNGNVSEEIVIGAVGGTPGANPANAVVAKLSQLWDSGGVITYSYLGGSDNQKFKVDRVILEWFPYANITFERSTVGTLRISFNPQLGSWSYVGKVNQSIVSPAATMNLGWIADDDVITEQDRGVILHEFGHVLGLLHEHQSPAREGTIQLDEGAVYEYYGYSQKWDKPTIKSQIIDAYNGSDVSNYSELDLTSVMMYFMPAEMNKQHIEVPPNHALSDKDKAYMIINYPRPTAHVSAPKWTLEYALQVSGVGATTVKKILAIKAGDGSEKDKVDKIREIFTRAQVVARTRVSLNGASDPGTNPTRAEGWCREKTASTVAVPNHVAHGVVGVASKLWLPHQTITYGFMEGDAIATPYRKSLVKKALEHYMGHTSLHFQEVLMPANLEDAAERAKCNVRISLGPVQQGHYGWSFVGRDALTAMHDGVDGPGTRWATIYIGGLPVTPEAELALTQHERNDATSTLYHELGHTLGLRHEASSPNSQILNGGIVEYLAASKYDDQSVMLYEGLTYRPPLVGKTPLNPMPSTTDLDILRLFYPDNGRSDGRFSRALDDFAFTPVNKVPILTKANAAIGNGTNVNPALVAELWSALALNLNLFPRLSSRVVLNAPLHDISGPAAAAAAPTTEQAQGFLLELVNAMKQFFNPGGNQMFTLQFPGRFLDQGSYAWDTSLAGIHGQFIKPVAVNEAEFRLVDQLYDLAPNVGGPNGTNLSIVYEQVLNNLLPKYVPNGLAKQQDQIRQWLMKDVPVSQWVKDIMKRQVAREEALAKEVAFSQGGFRPVADPFSPQSPGNSGFVPVPGAMFDISSKKLEEGGDKLNRIELSEILMNEYLYAKQDWEVERDTLISQASQADLGTPESKKALNDLTRKLAHITATRQAQLAAKYSDAVVRGYSHTVREYLGYLDIASPAEALQNAKDSMREAAMSSLDGSMKTYPVQLTPIDWSAGLSTSFSLEDLTQDAEVIRLQINAKSQRLDTLNSQLVSLQMGSKGDPSDLQSKVTAAQTALDSAQSALTQTYSSNVIAMANTCLDAVGKVDTGSLAVKINVAKDVLAKLPALMDTVQKAQSNLTSSSRALSLMMAALARAEASETKQQQQQLTLQIQSITRDLKELQTRWQILTSSSGGVMVPPRPDTSNQEAPKVVLPQETTSGGSRWQTISFTSSTETRSQLNLDQSSGENKQWSCNLWFGSTSGDSSKSSATVSNLTEATKDTIDLAFRATLVTVDRGGWFQPQFFKESKAFYKVNDEISWIDNKAKGVNGLLPGFPIGFIIAKDIVVRVTHSAASSADTKKVDREAAASSGGFLCFSYSQSDSKNSTSTSSSFQAFSNGYIMKIPGPQILGYMIQKTDTDDAHLMPSELPKDFFIPDEDYNNTVNGKGPAHGASPADGTTPGEKKEPAHGASSAHDAHSTPAGATITQDKMQEVLAKMLNDKVAEMFKTTTTAGPAPASA